MGQTAFRGDFIGCTNRTVTDSVREFVSRLVQCRFRNVPGCSKATALAYADAGARAHEIECPAGTHTHPGIVSNFLTSLALLAFFWFSILFDFSRDNQGLFRLLDHFFCTSSTFSTICTRCSAQFCAARPSWKCSELRMSRSVERRLFLATE